MLRLRRAALAWLLLTVATVLLHRASWLVAPSVLPSAIESMLKHVNNIVQVATMPGWLSVRLLHVWTHSLDGAIVGASIGWGFWTLIVLGALWARDRLVRPDAPDALSPQNLSRRRFIRNATISCGVTGSAGIVGGAAVSAVINPLGLRIARYCIPIAQLPESLDGLTIVQLSDLHLGPRVPESMIAGAVSKALALRADIYALTGDYIERGELHSDRIGELLAPLARAAPVGVVGVLGNHEYYGDWRRVVGSLQRAGIRMIDNARIFVSAERRLVEAAPVEGLCIGGVEDLSEAEPNVSTALGGVSPAMPRILLSHNPDVAETHLSARHRVDLLLCGHTHGGQVVLPVFGPLFVPSKFGDKYRIGLAPGPHCPVLISAGVGVTVMPLRIGVPPDILHITLRRA